MSGRISGWFTYAEVCLTCTAADLPLILSFSKNLACNHSVLKLCYIFGVQRIILSALNQPPHVARVSQKTGVSLCPIMQHPQGSNTEGHPVRISEMPV